MLRNRESERVMFVKQQMASKCLQFFSSFFIKTTTTNTQTEREKKILHVTSLAVSSHNQSSCFVVTLCNILLRHVNVALLLFEYSLIFTYTAAGQHLYAKMRCLSLRVVIKCRKWSIYGWNSSNFLHFMYMYGKNNNQICINFPLS